MPKADFKKTLLITSAIVLVTHLIYVLAGNAARAAGGTGGALTIANISHGITCLVMMWQAMLFRDHYTPDVKKAFKLYAAVTLALSALCIIIEAPLTTMAGGLAQVVKAMLLCWSAFLMWGGMLNFLAWVKISNEAKLAAARDEALEKQQKKAAKKAEKKK